jgi:hypothetical protein
MNPSPCSHVPPALLLLEELLVLHELVVLEVLLVLEALQEHHVAALLLVLTAMTAPMLCILCSCF